MANELWRLASARTDVTSPSRFNIKAPLSKEVCDQGPSLPSMVAAWSVSRITISVRFPTSQTRLLPSKNPRLDVSIFKYRKCRAYLWTYAWNRVTILMSAGFRSQIASSDWLDDLSAIGHVFSFHHQYPRCSRTHFPLTALTMTGLYFLQGFFLSGESRWRGQRLSIGEGAITRAAKGICSRSVSTNWS